MSKEKIEIKEQTNPPLLIADVSRYLTPHKCPVCGGNGLVSNGFYLQTSGSWLTTSITPEQCRSCGGTGIVWG
jgi:hypothetical protein